MEIDMKVNKWLLMVVMAFAFLMSDVFAGDSGLYKNPDRYGEGIALDRSGDTVVTYFFTYGADICGQPIPPSPSPAPPVPPDDCVPDGQRWFLGADPIVNNTVVTGLLYMTAGVYYPDGLSGVVGDDFAVGVYTLVREGEGWLLAVDRFGPELEADDYLFSTVFDFTTPLFYATD